MIGRFLHPGVRTLDAFENGQLEPKEHARVAAHVGRCHRCFALLPSTREIARRVREMPSPSLSEADSDALLARIHGSLRSGATVIVPPTEPVPQLDHPKPRWRAVGPWLLLAVGAVATLLLMVRLLDGQQGVLRFSHPAPRSGDALGLTYRIGALPTGQDQLRARLRLHGDDGRVETHHVALTRLRSEYTGQLVLPEWVVYAAFAVEDTTGTWVDSNGGRLWEVLAHDADGRPIFEALRESSARHAATHVHLALEAARAMIEHYPERAEAWMRLQAFERLLADGESMDSLTLFHQERFRELERALGGGALPPGELAAMVLYARSLGNVAAAERWTDRLRREAPDAHLALQLRVQQLERDHAGAPAGVLDGYERLWEEVGPQHAVAAPAFALAHRSGDGRSALLWSDRLLRLDPGARVSVAERLSTIPLTRQDGIRRLRTELERIAEGLDLEDRPLERSVREHRSATERTRRRILIALGNALLADGNPAAGSAMLLEAAELGWDPEVFRAAASARATAGDTASALPLLARVAIDPLTTADERREVASRAARHLSGWEWEDQMERARHRMHRQVLAEAVHERLPRKVTVEDDAGRTLDLKTLLSGEVAVVSLWHCLCAFLGPALDRHGSLTRELAAAGVPVVTVTVERTGAPWTTDDGARAEGLEVLRDSRGEALRAFGHARTPAYFVVDSNGYVRYRYASSEDVLRQALVVRDAVRMMAAALR